MLQMDKKGKKQKIYNIIFKMFCGKTVFFLTTHAFLQFRHSDRYHKDFFKYHIGSIMSLHFSKLS